MNLFILLEANYFTILYWFCHTSTWIPHGCTCVPHPEPSSHLLPHTISLGHPSAPAPSILYPASNLDWWLFSYMSQRDWAWVHIQFHLNGPSREQANIRRKLSLICFIIFLHLLIPSFHLSTLKFSLSFCIPLHKIKLFSASLWYTVRSHRFFFSCNSSPYLCCNSHVQLWFE